MAWGLATWFDLLNQLVIPKQVQAQWHFLQAQIRPHFLFNSLNSVMALIHVDAHRAEHLLGDLADLIRYTAQPMPPAVSLAEEITLAQWYLNLETIRFGERLNMVWHLDPAGESARLPPFTLQPLLENAVKHGVEPSPQGAKIVLTTQATSQGTWLTLHNTTPVPSQNKGMGIGLDNVKQRLALLHDLQSQWHWEQTELGVTVRFFLPQSH